MTATVPTISTDDLKQQLSKGDVQLVNVLEPEHYHQGMIRGSRRIPVSQIDKRMNELDKSKPVVTYCANYDCPASRQGAEKLMARGYSVRAYEGGIKEWKEAGLPME